MRSKKHTGLNTISNTFSKKQTTSIRITKYLTSIVNKFFPTTQINYDVRELGKGKYIQFYLWKDGNHCITILFNHTNKTIKLIELDTCNHPFNGRKSLTNVIQIAHKLNYKYIELIDVARIQHINSKTKKDCNLSLKIYNILLNGQSWYNKYGFLSKSHKHEQEQINTIRNTPFNNVLYQFSNYNMSIYSKMRDTLTDNLSINIGKKTKNVFKDLEKKRNSLSTNIEKDNFFCTLNPILELLNNNILYDYNLRYYIKK